MAVKVECAWARVFIRETKNICRLERGAGEGCTRFGGRVLAERYNAYYQHFKDYPLFFMDQKQFSRVAKILDSKFGTWRNKADKQAYLTRFSPSNWAEGKIITKEGKRNHSLSNCTTCQKFNWAYQGTFPIPKMCRSHKSGPLSEIGIEAKKLTNSGPKATNKRLREVGQAIYSTFDDRCKENFGKSFSEILVLVPEAGLQKKLTAVDKKKLRRNQQRKMKKETENQMAGDTTAHLMLRQSYSARQKHRLAQVFETPEEAAKRTRLTPPKREIDLTLLL